MAEASVFITWGSNKTGRETMGLGVFMASMAYFEKKKAAGALADVKVGLGDTGAISRTAGYIIAEGTNDQIANLLDDVEFKTHVTKAYHVVEDINVQRCTTGTAVPNRIESLLAVRKELGIV